MIERTDGGFREQATEEVSLASNYGRNTKLLLCLAIAQRQRVLQLAAALRASQSQLIADFKGEAMKVAALETGSASAWKEFMQPCWREAEELLAQIESEAPHA
jgi:hypothetical protein